jgi:hypothetical protein
MFLPPIKKHVFPKSSALMRGWMSFLTAILLTFYIGYIPLHLALEEHFENGAHVTEFTSHDDHDDDDHDSDAEHAPHASADHSVEFIAKSKLSLDVVYIIVSKITFSFELVNSSVVAFAEPFKVPKESPPDPLQPRAPPVA